MILNTSTSSIEKLWKIIHSKIREILIESGNARRNCDGIFSEFQDYVPKNNDSLNFWEEVLKDC